MDRKVFVSSDLKSLPTILSWIRNHLVQKGFDEQIVHRIELASEEALVNVLHHTYRDRPGKMEIAICWKPHMIEILIRDWGPPCNPLVHAPKVEQEASLEERKEGGLGLYLIHKMMDKVVYHREGDANLLILIKHFS